jgi:hypothetical protein
MSVNRTDFADLTEFRTTAHLHGEEGEALQVFGKMINEGIKANEFTTASILISCGNLKDSRNGKLVHGLAIKSGFESAVAS